MSSEGKKYAWAEKVYRRRLLQGIKLSDHRRRASRTQSLDKLKIHEANVQRYFPYLRRATETPDIRLTDSKRLLKKRFVTFFL